MNESQSQQQYRKDAAVLGEIGAVLVRADLPNIEIRLPQNLARIAAESWRRDDGPVDPESFEQRMQRDRAATLALIGLAVTERGRAEGDEVVVDLAADLIGSAIAAADDLAIA